MMGLLSRLAYFCWLVYTWNEHWVWIPICFDVPVGNGSHYYLKKSKYLIICMVLISDALDSIIGVLGYYVHINICRVLCQFSIDIDHDVDQGVKISQRCIIVSCL